VHVPTRTQFPPTPTLSGGAGATPGTEPRLLTGSDITSILAGVQETAYRWDLRSDAMTWDANAVGLLKAPDAAALKSGSAFHLLVAPEHAARRVDIIRHGKTAQGSAGGGIGGGNRLGTGLYRVQYRFQPGGRRDSASMWLEDVGTWTAGSDGRPHTASGVIRLVNDRYEEEQRLLFLSDHDQLSGQLNRIRLTEALDEVIRRSETGQQQSAFLIAGISNLSSINETFGFEVGDEVIASIGRRLKSRLRGGDSIGRYSSNKFGIILNDCGPGATRVAAERLLNAVREETIKAKACELPAIISIGGVQLPDQARSVQDAVGLSLEALDRAKAKRFGCFMSYEANHKRESERQRNRAIADEIVAAIQEDRMHIALQPIVRTSNRQAAFYECLLRMEKPDGTIVSAGEFIAVAERLGLGRMIDRKALELSVTLLKENPSLSLAINVSSLSTTDHEWLVSLHSLTGGRKELIQRLAVEITETAAIEDLDQTMSFVDALKELGCSVAIDDFGAGYTSFRNLKFLAVDMVKIDGSFVKNMTRDRVDRVFIETLVNLARTFNIETVAEWVGDEETAKALTEMGVTYLQGFHFGEPLLATKSKRERQAS
jgi:diguanylate cyclase (GGDEF)-like protein